MEKDLEIKAVIGFSGINPLTQGKPTTVSFCIPITNISSTRLVPQS